MSDRPELEPGEPETPGEARPRRLHRYRQAIQRSKTAAEPQAGDPPAAETISSVQPLPAATRPVLFLAVGKLRRPHGVRGEILMEIITDFPERLRPGMVVYLGDEHLPARLRTRRGHAQGLLLSFDNYQTPEEIGRFRSQLVQVRADTIPPLPEGEYYHHQLLGLRVIDEAGQDLGRLHEILDTGANEVYVVRPDAGADILLPAIPSVILSINLEQGEIHVHLLPGLVE